MIKLLELEGIGNVLLRKSNKARRISILIKPDRKVTVSLPYLSSFHDGERFLFSKIEWIQKHLTRLKENSSNIQIFDELSQFSTRTRKLKIQKESSALHVHFSLTHDTIEVMYPVDADIKSDRIQFLIKKGLIMAMQAEAVEYLPKRLSELAQEHGFTYKSVCIRNASTRWGSCSHDNRINLNLQLVRLPDELSDFIILHELAHIPHKNHSKTFWDKLERLANNAKRKTKEIKKYPLIRV